MERAKGGLGICLAFLVLMLSAWTPSVFAEPRFSARGRTYTHSCSYYTNRTGELELTLQGSDLPWGTTVAVEYGWSGTDEADAKLDWDRKGRAELLAVEPFVWKGRIEGVLTERGKSRRYNGLQFVFKIHVPGSDVVTVKGSDSARGFLVVSFPEVLTSDCVHPGGPLPEFRPYEVRSVSRDY